VLVANGDVIAWCQPRTRTIWRGVLPNSDLIIYPDAGHGRVFQFYADFVPKALAFLARSDDAGPRLHSEAGR